MGFLNLFRISPLLTLLAIAPLSPGSDLEDLFGIPGETEIVWHNQAVPQLEREWSRIDAIDIASPGQDRVLFRLTFEEMPNFDLADLRIFLDIDNDPETGRPGGRWAGSDLIFRIVNGTYSTNVINEELLKDTLEVRAFQEPPYLFVMVEAPWAVEEEEVRLNFQIEYLYDRHEEELRPLMIPRPFAAALPHNEHTLPAVPRAKTTSVTPLSHFRFVDNRGSIDDERDFQRSLGVAYEPLSDKGLTYDDVAPEEPMEFGRPTPQPPLQSEARADQPAAVELERVPVQLLEESGQDRGEAWVRFGFPLPKGVLFDSTQVRLVDGEGREIPAQFMVTGFWSDESIQWLLIDTIAALEGGEEVEWFVEFGNEVERSEPDHTITLIEEGEKVVVDTGAAKFTINREKFAFFEGVQIRDGEEWKEHFARTSEAGLVLLDEHKSAFLSAALPPEDWRVEVKGPSQVVLRVEGPLANEEGETFMRYLARLYFHAQSPVVHVELSLINDYLETEFADITSLSLGFDLASEAGDSQKQGTVAGQRPDWKPVATAEPFRVTQWHDQLSEIVVGEEITEDTERLPGVLFVERGPETLGVGLVDFWQRYPKQFHVDQDHLEIDLLPVQPGPEFGLDLPAHVLFPFCEGKYRFKWGFSFTERLVFDFGSVLSPEGLAGEAQLRVVAVLPGQWYADTGVFGKISAADLPLFEKWDAFFDKSFRLHEARRERQREYGYLNYGDWFGERGRNWGNNEYDTAHAFFMQFIRTGNRDYWRSALAAARHQTDVDMVHAYPDPFHVGANIIHAVAHSGTNSHRPTHGTWSHPYGNGVQAGNGHTWSEGMMEAWRLAGDMRSVEAVIGLGEHIVWMFAPQFEMSARMPRYAGWSLRAAMACYRATGDPLYLEAAETIALEARNKQDESGAWLRDFRGAPLLSVTNFQMGIILGGFKEYHRETGDPRIEDTMRAAGEFMKTAWRTNEGGWPYMILPDGRPAPHRAGIHPTMYIHISDGLSYLGELTGDPEYFEITADAFRQQLEEYEPVATGQRIGYTLRGGNASLGQLEEYLLQQEQAPDSDVADENQD